MKSNAVRNLSMLKRSAASALLLLAAASAAGAADWPMFRGNAARTGYSPEQAAPPFAEAWTFNAGDSVLSSPVVHDGVVYFGSRDGRLYARDARTGAALWNYRSSGWFEASPCVSSGTVYAVSLDGYLYALDRLTGSLKWLTPLGAPSVSSPLVSGGRVYVGTGVPDKKLKVFDALTGAPLGSFQAQQPVDSAPSAYGQNVYFGSNDGSVYALDAASLQPPAGWTHYPTAGSFRMNAVALLDGRIYALPGHDEKKVFALDAATGNQLSTSTALEQAESWQTFTSPAAAGGRLYFSGAIGETGALSAGNNYMSALDTGTLVSVWASSPSLGGISNLGLLSSPALAGELLFAGTADGRLVAVSSAGAQAAVLTLSSAAYSSPAVSNGMVYIGDMAGKFFAYSAGRAAAISSPLPGAVINGTAAVRGYAANPAMSGYTLAYSTGGSPEAWHNIVSSVTAGPVGGAVVGYWDTTALANGAYTLRFAVQETGSPDYENLALAELRVNSVPQPPSGLTAADVPGDSGNRIALSWTASATAGITLYRVYRDDGSGFALLASTAPSPMAYTDTAAVTGNPYTYAVRAYDGYMESADSNQAAASSVNDTGDNTPPAAITDLAGKPGAAAGSVELAWTAPGNDGNIGYVDHFVIRYTTVPGFDWSGFDGVAGSTLPAEGPAGDNMGYSVTGLFGGVTYYFAIKSADEVPNISQLSNIATAYAAVDRLPPLPPSALLVMDTPGDDGGSLTLTWTLSPDDGAGARDVYGYKIYRRTLTGAFNLSAPYAVTAAGAWSYKDAAAPQNVRYYYAVAAFDSSNNSVLSGESSGVSADNYRFVDASQGGYFLLPDGARVDVPGNALSQNDSFIFVKLDPATYEPLSRIKAASGANPTDIVYKASFRNPATRLTGRARLTLPYTAADISGMEEENLRVYTLSGGSWGMLNTSAVDAAAKKVSAEVAHFSIFRIMEYVPSGALFGDNEVYSYPNPAKGDTVTFKFRVTYKAYVKIDVYSVAGEKVAALELADCPAGQTSEIRWNTADIASGVYVYRFEAQSSAGSRSIVKKLAIIH